MNRETIIRLAQEAGLWNVLEVQALLPELERFAELVAKAERHRICEMLRDRHAKEERHNYYLFIANIIKESK